MPAVRFIVSGKVQGVHYRDSAREEALRLGITGWIQNTPENTVIGVAVGGEEQLRQFISWCKQGPPLSQVDSLHVEGVPVEVFPDFSILR